MTPAVQCRQGTYEIPLDPEVSAALCRRGRRRLRDIQAACGVPLQLDRARCSLFFSNATTEQAAVVRKHIAGLVGPRHNVPPAVWAELMRTRAILDGEDATVIRMQEECGCRIHIERFRYEVRLFGEAEDIKVAMRLLAELEQRVGEESIGLAFGVALCNATLHGIALHHGVTVQVEQARVVLFGLRDRLMVAAEDVRSYMAEPHNPRFADMKRKFEMSQPLDASAPALVEQARPAAEASPSPFKSLAAGQPPSAQKPKGGTGASAASQRGLPGRQAQKRETAPKVQQQPPIAEAGVCGACPTCGCGRFCSNCGVPVWQVVLAPDMATYAAFVAQAQRPLLSYSGVPSGCDTPDTPHTLDTLPPMEDPSSPSYCATPQRPASAMVAEPQQMQRDGATMVPVMAPVCFVQSGVHNAALRDSSGSGGPAMQACMVPAGAVQGWVVQGSAVPSMEQLPWIVSQAPSLEHLPWMGA